MIPGGWGTGAVRSAGSNQESRRDAGRGQAGSKAQRPPRAVAKLSEKFEAGGERSPGVGGASPQPRGRAREEPLPATSR